MAGEAAKRAKQYFNGVKFPRPVFPFFLAALALAWVGCVQDSGAERDPAVMPLLEDELGPTPQKPVYPAGWPEVAWPADNPYSAEKAFLGRRLFFDPRFSSDGVVSCAWCHDPRAAFTNLHGGLGTGAHHQPVLRGPPTLLNVAFATRLMTDGSVGSLEEQALFPLLARHEMDMTIPAVLEIVRGDTLYARLFRQAYGPKEITFQDMARALATYQRTLASHSTPWDRAVFGDSAGLSLEARAGLALFNGKAGCAACHTPPLFTDGDFHDIGLDAAPRDSGRMKVTGLLADLGRFKTPTLRNVGATAPYMHDGRFRTLEEVIRHYNAGGAPGATPDSGVRPLGLNDRETQALAEFLRALQDP